MADFRRQAERFGAQFLTDDVTKVDFSERPFRVWVDDEEYRARSVIVATGASARWLGLRQRSVSRDAASRPARPATARSSGTGDRRRRRRRLRIRGGAVPDAVRDEGDARAPTRRVPRVADHGRPRTRERQDRVPDAVRRRRGHRRREGHGRPAPPFRDGRALARSTPTGSSSRSATTRTRSSSSTSSTTTRTGTSLRSRARPRRTSPASSRSATSRTTSTARP